MKFMLFAASIIGMAFCAPPQMFMEFDIHHAPVEAAPVIPAGVPAGKLEVLLPVDSQRQLIGGPVRGFIKQEIPRPNGKDEEVFYPFGFNLPDPAPVAPVAPAAPVAPIAPVAPVAPAAPVAPIAPVDPAAPIDPVAPAAPVDPVLVVAVPVPAAKPRGDDDDEEEDD